MRSAIYLDAHVLACPPSEEGLNVFLEYITNLVSWRELRQNDWIDVYLSRNAAQSLAEANAYPPYPELIKTITAFGIKHIQPKDVVDLVNGFLLKSRVIEDEIGVDDILFEDFTLDPLVPYKARRASFPYHFELLSVLLCMHRTFITDIHNQLLLTSRDLNYYGHTKANTTITALTKMTNNLMPDIVVEPFAVTANFFLCTCLLSLNLGTDPCSVWANAKGDTALRKAIELFTFQDQPNHSTYTNIISDVKFSFGSHFLESCINLGFFNEPAKINMLLRACSETLLNMNNATHWIRTSTGGSASQLKRGNDAAWRRDIDHEYHLHYWITIDGFEFSVVVHHNDFSIPLD